MNSSHGFEQYKDTIRSLSDRIVEAQRPIRILDAIKWDASIQDAFFRSKFKELPRVDREYYQSRPLAFDAGEKRREFKELGLDISRKLGEFNPIGEIMRRMCHEYVAVVDMLDSRGLSEFSIRSQELYGSAGDVFYAGDPTLADLGMMMSQSLENIDRNAIGPTEERTIPGEQAVEILQQRLNLAFPDPTYPVHVKLSDGIISDAAAGFDYIKIRKEAMFNERDLRLLEFHEGWVHVGTTLNGSLQPVCTFLSKGPPSSTVTQEGLAILMEILAFASFPSRLRRLTNRIHAVAMAEAGANFIEIFNFFREQSFTESESFINTARVFRGSTPDGGPFTKDICYSKGFVLIFNYIGLAVRKGMLSRIPLLFCGKTTLKDMRALSHAVDEGIVTPPKFLPPQFADLNALIAFMCYSTFINHLNLQRIESDYSNLL